MNKVRTPEEELRRAADAQRLLEDPLFVEGRLDLYEQLRTLRRDANPRDTAMHSRLILMEQMADRFFGYFEQMAQTGRLATNYLQDQESRERGMRERFASYLAFGRNGL